jgi:hypothetical protein
MTAVPGTSYATLPARVLDASNVPSSTKRRGSMDTMLVCRNPPKDRGPPSQDAGPWGMSDA